MRIGSLFAGIGGLELGLERAGVGHTVWQVEKDGFCRDVLARHWPDAVRYEDVTTVDWSQVEPVDVICGGYPCQPFSTAARGRNNAVDLWPHMLRAVSTLAPRYVVLENVAAHLGRGFSSVLADLAAIGFDAEWSTLTACSVGAPHTRRRLFAIAYPNGGGEPVGTVNAEAPRLGTDASDSRDGWLPAAGCPRTDDGVSRRMDRRRARALGNAVVPQVAEVVGRRLLELEGAV